MAIRTIFWLSAISLCLAACAGKAPEKEQTAAEVKTPVGVAAVEFGALTDSIDLNATSSFLQNYYIKATSTGYIRAVNVRPGEYLEAGKELFRIETKESMVIGKSVSSLDSTFKFTGLSTIKSSGHGYITQLNHQLGDYVQDGEQLAVISDMNSFVFLLNLPYEWRPLVLNKKRVQLLLPDGMRLQGTISQVMPTVDSLSQTQTVVIRTSSSVPIPQNLIARVRISRTEKTDAQTVPKSAVLTDDAQTNYWVMKMIDSSTAAKTPVRKGIEWKDRIEILDPRFSKTDLILVSGNYGLPDTAKVFIEKP